MRARGESGRLVLATECVTWISEDDFLSIATISCERESIMQAKLLQIFQNSCAHVHALTSGVYKSRVCCYDFTEPHTTLDEVGTLKVSLHM